MNATHSYRGWTQPLPDTPSTTAWNRKGSSHQAPRSTHSYHVERNPRPTNHSKGLKFQGGGGHFNLVQPHRNGMEWPPGPVENRETVGKLWIFNHLQPPPTRGLPHAQFVLVPAPPALHHGKLVLAPAPAPAHHARLALAPAPAPPHHQPTTLSSCWCRHQQTRATLGLYWCRHHNPPTTLGT